MPGNRSPMLQKRTLRNRMLFRQIGSFAIETMLDDGILKRAAKTLLQNFFLRR